MRGIVQLEIISNFCFKTLCNNSVFKTYTSAYCAVFTQAIHMLQCVSIVEDIQTNAACRNTFYFFKVNTTYFVFNSFYNSVVKNTELVRIKNFFTINAELVRIQYFFIISQLINFLWHVRRHQGTSVRTSLLLLPARFCFEHLAYFFFYIKYIKIYLHITTSAHGGLPSRTC